MNVLMWVAVGIIGFNVLFITVLGIIVFFDNRRKWK